MTGIAAACRRPAHAPVTATRREPAALAGRPDHLQNAGWALAFICLGAAVVLFPDGRLPSRHWRWPWRIYLALSAVGAAGLVVILLTAVAGHHVRIDSSGDLAIIDHPTGAAVLWGVIEQAGLIVLAACLVAAVMQQAAGYRRACGASS